MGEFTCKVFVIQHFRELYTITENSTRILKRMLNLVYLFQKRSLLECRSSTKYVATFYRFTEVSVNHSEQIVNYIPEKIKRKTFTVCWRLTVEVVEKPMRAYTTSISSHFARLDVQNATNSIRDFCWLVQWASRYCQSHWSARSSCTNFGNGPRVSMQPCSVFSLLSDQSHSTVVCKSEVLFLLMNPQVCRIHCYCDFLPEQESATNFFFASHSRSILPFSQFLCVGRVY